MAQQEAREVAMYYMKLFEDIVNDNIEWLITSYPGLIMDCDELVEYLGELFTDLFVGGEQYLKRGYVLPWEVVISASLAQYLCFSLLTGAIPLAYSILRNIFEIMVLGTCLDLCNDYSELSYVQKTEKARRKKPWEIRRELQDYLRQSSTRPPVNLDELYSALSNYLHALTKKELGGLMDIIDKSLENNVVPTYLSLLTLSRYNESAWREELNRLRKHIHDILSLVKFLVNTWRITLERQEA